MIVIKIDVTFKFINGKYQRCLESTVYEEGLNGFYRCSQIISPETLGDIRSSRLDIRDVIEPLEGVGLSEDEVKDLIIDFFKEEYIVDSLGSSEERDTLIREARSFLLKYKRDMLIDETLKK